MNAPSFESQRKAKMNKLKFQLQKISILIVIFAALFSLSFYIVNLWNIKPAAKLQQISETSADNLAAGNGVLASALGSSNVSMADFNAWAEANNLSGADVYNADPDKDGLPNYLEYVYGTDPNNADTDGDGFSDKQEIANGYDPDAKGDIMTKVEVKISRMNVDVPMVWSKTDVESNMLKDLESGVAHFVKTASPGQNGNMIISGHSSNYIWAKGAYNYIFKNLNDLQKGDVVEIKTMQRNGRVITYKYQISDKFVATPDDERIFEDTNNPSITLSTCWPLGTNLKRMIVKGNLVQ